MARLPPPSARPPWPELFFDTITAASSDPIVAADRDGRILSWNPAAERLFQYTKREIRDQSWGLLVPGGGEDAAARLWRLAARGRLSRTVRARGRRKDGSEIAFDLAIAICRSDLGVLYVGTVLRVTATTSAGTGSEATSRSSRGTPAA